MIEVLPNRVDYELLLTAQAPVINGDPAVKKESNASLFNRQVQILSGAPELAMPGRNELYWFASQHAFPYDVAPIFEDVSFPEFVGVVLVRLFLDAYNRRDGTGIFEGMERYNRLEERLRNAATQAMTLRGCWDRLCHSLRVPMHPTALDEAILNVFSVPLAVQQRTLRSLVKDYRSLVAIARRWHRMEKMGDPNYADKLEEGDWRVQIEPRQVLKIAEVEGRPAGAVNVELPAIQPNGLRHQMVREPGWLRLFGLLGLRATRPGLGPVPAGVEAAFYNGGNLERGVHAPSNAFSLTNEIRERFPILDLVSGNSDSFGLGEGRLQIAAWIVCKENASVFCGTLAEALPNAQLSIFDMMDDVTLTRHSGQVGEGQMPFSVEALAQGAQIYVRLSLTPHSDPRTHGALVDAIEAWRADDATIGGGAARGFGHCKAEWLRRHEDADAYRQAYLDDVAANADALREGLIDGTLCTKSVVLT